MQIPYNHRSGRTPRGGGISIATLKKTDFLQDLAIAPLTIFHSNSLAHPSPYFAHLTANFAHLRSNFAHLNLEDAQNTTTVAHPTSLNLTIRRQEISPES